MRNEQDQFKVAPSFIPIACVARYNKHLQVQFWKIKYESLLKNIYDVSITMYVH